MKKKYLGTQTDFWCIASTVLQKKKELAQMTSVC